MPRRKAVKDTTTIYPCWVSGNALEAGVQDQFDKEYSVRRDFPLGYRVRFDLLEEDARRLVDIMSELAIVISDEEGTTADSRVESIYRDLFRFPEKVRPR